MNILYNIIYKICGVDIYNIHIGEVQDKYIKDVYTYNYKKKTV